MPVAPFPTGNTANFVPEVWSKKLQAKYYKNTVLGAICNHDWEGEIKGQGNKVIIRQRPTVAVNDYDGSDIVYGDLETGKLELMIDKAKSYAFKVDDIAAVQSDIKLINEATDDATQNMKIAIDADVLGSIYADIPAQNIINTAAGNITKDTILDYLVDMGTILDEQDVPETGRWLVLPPKFCGMIKKSDLKDASLTGDGTSVMRNGRLGMIDRFTIYSSNNIAVVNDAGTNKHMIMAGTKDFCSFASQFVKTETLRLEKQFGDAIRGLNVYGYKVTKPEAGVLLRAA